MIKPAIPDPLTLDAKIRSFISPLKVNVEVITGVRGTPITPIGPTPTNAEIATKINQILTLLQG